MPQSLSRLHVHAIFATKHRTPWLRDEIRESLHRYMATVLHNDGSPAELINSVEDHVHMLLLLGRTSSVSHVIEQVKKASSKWIKTLGTDYAEFAWQSGYGAFAVSESQVETVRRYIAIQREHHRKATFEDEYRAFLQRNQIAFDERFVWD